MPQLTTSGAIDKIQSLFYDVDIDADNAALRLRILEWHQEGGDEVWNHRPWPFRIAKATVTVLSGNNKVALPDDFQEFGPHGSVHGPPSGKTLLEERSPQEITRLQQLGIAGNPTEFAVFDSAVTAGLTSAAVSYIQIPQTAGSGGIALALAYEVTPPTFTDVATVPNGYDKFPVSFHYSTVFAAVKALAAQGIGDARAASEFEGKYQRGLMRMEKIMKTRRSSVRKLPRAIPGGMW